MLKTHKKVLALFLLAGLVLGLLVGFGLGQLAACGEKAAPVEQKPAILRIRDERLIGDSGQTEFVLTDEETADLRQLLENYHQSPQWETTAYPEYFGTHEIELDGWLYIFDRYPDSFGFSGFPGFRTEQVGNNANIGAAYAVDNTVFQRIDEILLQDRS